MRIQITLLSLIVATTLSVSTVFAASSAKDAKEQVKEKPESQKAVEGLNRQGKGGLGNENADKVLKALDGDSKPASGDNTKKVNK
ncbi:MAG: hypothetical protein ACYCZS_10540 [Thiobacillus sp.]